MSALLQIQLVRDMTSWKTLAAGHPMARTAKPRYTTLTLYAST
jgi:hypothetical protein